MTCQRLKWLRAYSRLPARSGWKSSLTVYSEIFLIVAWQRMSYSKLH